MKPLVATKSTPPIAPEGRVMFFKGGSIDRFNEDALPDGSLSMDALLSNPPGDFSRNKRILYLTKQRQCAWEYAEYAKARAPIDCGILYLAISKALVQDRREIRGEEWYDILHYVQRNYLCQTCF
jgi:hypothetical protein